MPPDGLISGHQLDPNRSTEGSALKTREPTRKSREIHRICSIWYGSQFPDKRVEEENTSSGIHFLVTNLVIPKTVLDTAAATYSQLRQICLLKLHFSIKTVLEALDKSWVQERQVQRDLPFGVQFWSFQITNDQMRRWISKKVFCLTISHRL